MSRFAFVLFVLPACATTADSGDAPEATEVRFVEGAVHDTTRGAFEVRAWTDDGAMDSHGPETCFFEVTMSGAGDDARGIPGLELDLLAGADLSTADPLDVDVEYEGDGVYRVDAVSLGDGMDLLHVEIATDRVADSITYRVR